MNEFDNNKLIGYLRAHGVDVLSCTHDTITCRTLLCSGNAKPVYIVETIHATMPAVNHYLGH